MKSAAHRFATVVVALGVFGCGRPPPQLVEQDVSFLVPLEKSRGFLMASTVLPRALFDGLHPLTVVDEPDALYGALSVVSVRLDACFREGANPGPCQPQVRLVLQPVFDDGAGVTTRDCAVHLFFSTSEAEVVGLVRELAGLRVERGLTVSNGLGDAHPGFADERWVKQVREKLGRLMESRRIVRITSMSVHASNQAWVFSGRDLDAEHSHEISIPSLGETHEHHVTSTGQAAALEVRLDPSSPVEPSLTSVIARGGLAAASPSDLTAAADAVRRLEDPAVHNPGTVDCASCHVAAMTQRALAKHGVAVDTTVAASSAFDDTRNLRAFGYFYSAAAISPRVQRETTLARGHLARLLEK